MEFVIQTKVFLIPGHNIILKIGEFPLQKGELSCFYVGIRKYNIFRFRVRVRKAWRKPGFLWQILGNMWVGVLAQDNE